jgi:nucleoside-diphosphate-sugar epimerase
MKILVIGATGIIGPGVVKALVEENWQVTALHRGITPYSFSSSVNTIHLDRKNQNEFEKIVRSRSFDVIIDLECYDQNDAASTVRAAKDCRRLIVFSTVLTFGGKITEIVKETTPLLPVSEYGRNKVDMDRYLMNAHISGDVNVTIIKPVACYREGSYLDGQLNESSYWIDRLIRGCQSVLADKGEALWNVIHSDDVGKAIALMLKANVGMGEDFIIASKTPVTWNWYYKTVANALNVSFNPIYIPTEFILNNLGNDANFLLEMSLWNQIYDISKLESVIPLYSETISLKTGLEKSVNWLVNNYNIQDENFNRKIEKLIINWKTHQNENNEQNR